MIAEEKKETLAKKFKPNKFSPESIQSPKIFGKKKNIKFRNYGRVTFVQHRRRFKKETNRSWLRMMDRNKNAYYDMFDAKYEACELENKDLKIEGLKQTIYDDH